MALTQPLRRRGIGTLLFLRSFQAERLGTAAVFVSFAAFRTGGKETSCITILWNVV